MHKPVPQVLEKQKFIYKFIISLIPFIFEKIKNVECSYLMLHHTEIELLVFSELRNYLDMLRAGIEKVHELRDHRIVFNLMRTVEELLSSAIFNPVVEKFIENNMSKPDNGDSLNLLTLHPLPKNQDKSAAAGGDVEMLGSARGSKGADPGGDGGEGEEKVAPNNEDVDMEDLSI